MILVTVGTQLPFERLVRAMDGWCDAHPEAGVWGQIGNPGVRGYRPRRFPWVDFESPDVLETRLCEASVIVAHAGMGSIITAMLNQVPIVIMPRRAHLGEHRNDHQYATARAFADRSGVHVAWDEEGIPEAIARALLSRKVESAAGVHAYASAQLIQAVRDVVQAQPGAGLDGHQKWAGSLAGWFMGRTRRKGRATRWRT